MGYFNYFIKCIIRNITYKLFKPKVFITVLLCVVILLFCFKNYGYCVELFEVTPNAIDGDIILQFDNTYLTLRSIQEDAQKDFITYMYASFEKNPEDTKNFASILLGEILNSTDKGMYYYIVKGDSNSTVKYAVSVYGWSDLSFSHIGYYGIGNYTFHNCTYLSGTFWTRSILSDGSFNTTSSSGNKDVPMPFLRVIVPEWRQMFIDFGLIQTEMQKELFEKLDALINKSTSENSAIVNKLEEQNQIQQEQNDFLKQETSDEDVSVDSFNSVDSNDITSDGLTGVFTNIYNSITSWSSKDINLPIPYTNKSIVIPANYTENMLSSFGGSWIITFISSIYYFIVARFIIYSITSIINSIKSGSILETDSKNNITTDML